MIIGCDIGHVTKANLGFSYVVRILLVFCVGSELGRAGVGQRFADFGRHVLCFPHKNYNAILQLQYAVVLAGNIVRSAFCFVAEGIQDFALSVVGILRKNSHFGNAEAVGNTVVGKCACQGNVLPPCRNLGQRQCGQGIGQGCCTFNVLCCAVAQLDTRKFQGGTLQGPQQQHITRTC